MRKAVQTKHIVLQEWLIENELEAANISKMYMKQISKALHGKQKKPKKIVSQPDDSASETDEDEEYLENMFIASNHDKKDDSHAADLLKKF